MLMESQEFELYSEWAARIGSPATLEAFQLLVGIAACSTQYRCNAQWKGEVRDFRFYDIASGEQPFAFIVNRRWLLFYFRQPAVRSAVHSKNRLRAEFDTFGENPRGEWTVKLTGVGDVRRLCEIVDLT